MYVSVFQESCCLPSLWVTRNKGDRSLGNNTEMHENKVSFLVSLNVYVCTTALPSAPRDQKRPADLLKLELEVVVRCYVSAGNPIRVLCMNSKC